MRRKWLVAAAILAGMTGKVWGLARASESRAGWTTESVLRELTQEARSFHSLSGEVERTKVTVVVNDRATEQGQIFVRDNKMLLEMKSPDLRTILRTGDNLYVYTPGLKQVEEFNLGKHRALVDQFLLLGFGSSGRELQKRYLVTLLGEQTLDGKRVVQLELTPKSKEVRNQISKIELWLDASSWLPVRQQFFETGTQDYFIIRYSNLIRNPRIPESRFKPHWPKGTQKIKAPS